MRMQLRLTIPQTEDHNEIRQAQVHLCLPGSPVARLEGIFSARSHSCDDGRIETTLELILPRRILALIQRPAGLPHITESLTEIRIDVCEGILGKKGIVSKQIGR